MIFHPVGPVTERPQSSGPSPRSFSGREARRPKWRATLRSASYVSYERSLSKTKSLTGGLHAQPHLTGVAVRPPEVLGSREVMRTPDRSYTYPPRGARGLEPSTPKAQDAPSRRVWVASADGSSWTLAPFSGVCARKGTEWT